jgi:hypothetical protein
MNEMGILGDVNACRSKETYLIAGVCSVADVDKVTEFWWVDFLVLGSNQERGDSNQLQLWAGHFVSLKVTIDKVDRQVKSLRDQLELQMNLNKPVNKDRSHAFVDVGLGLHEHGANRTSGLLGAKVFVHVHNIFRGTERIISVSLINVINLADVLVTTWIDADSRCNRVAALNNNFRARWDRGLDGNNGDVRSLVDSTNGVDLGAAGSVCDILIVDKVARKDMVSTSTGTGIVTTVRKANGHRKSNRQ